MRSALVALCLANFMAALDLFVVNVALQDIGADLGGSLTGVSWVLNAYAIVFGALLIPAGRAADRFGRKRLFLLGAALFTAASVACALCPSLWTLVAARGLQAAGAAILVPASLSLVLTTTAPERRASSVRTWAVSSALAGATGPVAGGLLTQLDWRWIFLINAPIGIATIVAAARWVPSPPRRPAGRVPDPVEAVLLMGTAGALSLAVAKATDWGWTSAETLSTGLIAVLCGTACVAANRRSAAPVLDRTLFRSRPFAAANLSMLLGAAGLAMQLLGLSLFLQRSWQWSPLATGAALAPAPLATFLAARLAARLAPKVRPAALAAVGFLGIALGQATITATLAAADGHHFAYAVLPGWIVSGAGGGLAVPTLTWIAGHGLPPDASAGGSAVLQVARQFGSAIGTAVLVATLAAGTGFAASSWICVAFYVAAAGAVAWAWVSRAPRERARSR
ncbi:DHA2 family efflux MFS transporter permease subunit [Dactylosporangium sp. CA-092794]|uniref:DHA2 family efflux MFS transporter permease subunit n=1 Tax=Dactylosporangium sp. CA-092794 TaxID=3239929 RepID=UPI003D8FAAF8